MISEFFRNIQEAQLLKDSQRNLITQVQIMLEGIEFQGGQQAVLLKRLEGDIWQTEILATCRDGEVKELRRVFSSGGRQVNETVFSFNGDDKASVCYGQGNNLLYSLKRPGAKIVLINNVLEELTAIDDVQ